MFSHSLVFFYILVEINGKNIDKLQLASEDHWKFSDSIWPKLLDRLISEY